MKNLKIVFALVSIILFSVTLSAQHSTYINDDSDFSRKGFFLSIGLGVGSGKEKVTYGDVQSQSENFISLVGDMTMGLGLTQQAIGFITLKQNWYTVEYETDKMSTSFEFVGIGGSYFLKSTPSSPFVTAGIGIASHLILKEKGLRANGLGSFLGLGYALNKNTSVKIEAIWGNPNIEVLDEQLFINTISIGVSANYSF